MAEQDKKLVMSMGMANAKHAAAQSSIARQWEAKLKTLISEYQEKKSSIAEMYKRRRAAVLKRQKEYEESLRRQAAYSTAPPGQMMQQVSAENRNKLDEMNKQVLEAARKLKLQIGTDVRVAQQATSGESSTFDSVSASKSVDRMQAELKSIQPDSIVDIARKLIAGQDADGVLAAATASDALAASGSSNRRPALGQEGCNKSKRSLVPNAKSISLFTATKFKYNLAGNEGCSFE